jgi:hypothetical protein
MRHRTSLLSTSLVLGLLAVSAGAAQAQGNTSKPDAKTLQKQCLALAQRDSTRDNTNMAAPAPTITDSLRTLCDSVNAANPDFKKEMDKVQKEHKDMDRPSQDTTMTTVPANPTPPSAETPSTSEPQPPSTSSTAAPKTETSDGSNPQ